MGEDNRSAAEQGAPSGIDQTGAGSGQVPGKQPQDLFLKVSRSSLSFRYLFLSGLTVVIAVLIFVLLPSPGARSEYFMWAFLAVWAAALIRYWIFVLAMPHRMHCKGNEEIEMFSVFQVKEVPCKEIRAFKVSPIYPTYIRIETTDRKTIRMVNHMDGLHELIHRIKQVNPDLETRGC